jgi:hypothetical protein
MLFSDMIAILLLLAAAPAEEVLAKGGELAGPPAQTIENGETLVVAWGFAEVPPKSRMQAAYALTDANARAELVKLVRVQVEDSLKSNSTATTEEIETRTREAAHGVLPAISPAQHGWRRLKRGGEQVLQVWSRIALDRSRMHEIISKAVKK